MYDFVPVCETPSGHCVKSNVQLCDIKPPQFPAWFNSEKKSMLMKNCPSWKAYEENCKGGFDSPPWWAALIVITFLFITGLVIFLLYKKKRLKWASRVSDVSLQAKQMCCKHAVETSNTKSKDKDPSCPKGGGDKTQEIRDRVTGSQLEDNFGSPTPATEPYYYVLEERSSVVVIKNSSPEMGTFGRRVIPPTPPPQYRAHLPPLNCINNNGHLNHGKPAVLFYPSGKVQVAEDERRENTGPEKRKKKKGKSKQNSSQLSSTSNIDDKYTYAD